MELDIHTHTHTRTHIHINHNIIYMKAICPHLAFLNTHIIALYVILLQRNQWNGLSRRGQGKRNIEKGV
jgi:hypothetical protein